MPLLVAVEILARAELLPTDGARERSGVLGGRQEAVRSETRGGREHPVTRGALVRHVALTLVVLKKRHKVW